MQLCLDPKFPMEESLGQPIERELSSWFLSVYFPLKNGSFLRAIRCTRCDFRIRVLLSGKTNLFRYTRLSNLRHEFTQVWLCFFQAHVSIILIGHSFFILVFIHLCTFHPEKYFWYHFSRIIGFCLTKNWSSEKLLSCESATVNLLSTNRFTRQQAFFAKSVNPMFPGEAWHFLLLPKKIKLNSRLEGRCFRWLLSP